MGMISRVKDAKFVFSAGPLDLEVTYSAYHDPGNTYGPIEAYYPPENECEVTAITYSGEDIRDLLSEEWIEKIEEAAWEDANTTWSDDEQAEAMYEAWREEQERRCE